MFEPGTLAILIPLLPLSAAVITALVGPRYLREQSHWPAIVGIAGSFLCSVLLAFHVAGGIGQRYATVGFEEIHPLWQWVNVSEAYELNQGSPAVAVDAAKRNFDITISLRTDSLTSIMLIMVTFVSSLVAIYSVGYMHGDRGYWRFFAYVSLFVFSMTMLVSVSNFLLLYIFWEAVGVCSYLLIGYWYEKSEAAAAGKKAFLVNRVGDFGFALAIFFIWTTYGTLNFHDVGNFAGVLGQQRLEGSVPFATGGIATAICLLLLLGACGKSAQFPLHVWLPDAMEGPTPVSALIHAATMVTAGVYMVARCVPLFMASTDALVIVAAIGGTTALLAALIALTQTDLKRVLAYSTISQLGYMFLALGTGTLAGVSAGMFHLFTHAFFKALLFLGAGSVMHAMGSVIDMRRFGGLRNRLPITHATFAIGCLALAGVFPFAGFWSKDAVVASVYDKVHASPAADSTHARIPATAEGQLAGGAFVEFDGGGDHGPAKALISADAASSVYQLLYYVALITAFLTAFYTFRAYFLTFHGEERIPYEAGDHAHESPPSMWLPLCALAVFAIVIGGLLEIGHLFDGDTGLASLFHWLPTFSSMLGHTPSLAYGQVQASGHPAFHAEIAMLSTIVALAGIGLSAYLYLGDRREVESLAYWMSFRWLNHLAEMGWAARLARMSWVAAIHQGAKAIGIGWLTRFIGHVLLVIICVVISPLLMGFYLSPYRLSFHKFFFDELYNVLIVWPLRAISSISYAWDRFVIDGIVNLIGWIPKAAGGVMRGLQIGLIPFYGLAMILGALAFIAARTIWGAV